MSIRVAAILGVTAVALAAAGCAGPTARSGRAETEAGSRRIDRRTGVEYVLVPGGGFVPGFAHWAAPGQPAPPALVESFWLAKTEVTVGQFRRFTDATGYRTEAERGGVCGITREGPDHREERGSSWRNPGYEQRDDHPVVFVTWNDAAAYCAWAGCRLPTELEWEYAGGNGTRHTLFSWGDEDPAGRRGGNVADLTAKRVFGWDWAAIHRFAAWDDGHAYPAPVCSYEPNDFGLCDMTGNVAEPCGNPWQDDLLVATPWEIVIGFTTEARHSIRGGGWDCEQRHLWIPRRFRITKDRCDGATGFRPAMSLGSESR